MSPTAADAAVEGRATSSGHVVEPTASGHPGEPTAPAWRGELELTVAPRAGRSVAVHQFHRGALRVLRPHYLDATGQVTYAVVNPGGAFLDRDRYRLDVRVEQGGELLLTTQSATKVYRTPVDHTAQVMDVVLGPGARLEYLPDQLIAYRESRYRQLTRVEMAASSSLVLSEVVTPGWSPTGEPFRYERVHLRTEVVMDGTPVALDNLLLEPAPGLPGRGGMAFFEGHTHVGSLLIVDPRVDQAALDAVRAMLAQRQDHLVGGATALSVPGMALRVLGDSTQEIDELILAVIGHFRDLWFAQGPVNLRKY